MRVGAARGRCSSHEVSHASKFGSAAVGRRHAQPMGQGAVGPLRRGRGWGGTAALTGRVLGGEHDGGSGDGGGTPGATQRPLHSACLSLPRRVMLQGGRSGGVARVLRVGGSSNGGTTPWATQRPLCSACLPLPRRVMHAGGKGRMGRGVECIRRVTMRLGAAMRLSLPRRVALQGGRAHGGASARAQQLCAFARVAAWLGLRGSPRLPPVAAVQGRSTRKF